MPPLSGHVHWWLSCFLPLHNLSSLHHTQPLPVGPNRLKSQDDLPHCIPLSHMLPVQLQPVAMHLIGLHWDNCTMTQQCLPNLPHWPVPHQPQLSSIILFLPFQLSSNCHLDGTIHPLHCHIVKNMVNDEESVTAVHTFGSVCHGNFPTFKHHYNCHWRSCMTILNNPSDSVGGCWALAELILHSEDIWTHCLSYSEKHGE